MVTGRALRTGSIRWLLEGLKYITVIRVMPPSARYSYTRSACCRPACGRARIEFSICTIAGPGRAGVGVGVAGSAVVPHPARAASAALMASTASSRFTAVDIHAQYKEKRQRQPNRAGAV